MRKPNSQTELTCPLCPRGASPNLCSAVASSARSDSSGSVGRRAHPLTGLPRASCHSGPDETGGRWRWDAEKEKNREMKTSHIWKKASLCYCIVPSSRVWKTNSQGSQTGQPAVGTINRSTGVTGGHSQHSTDSRPSSWTHSSHLGHSPLLPLRNLNGSIQ